ncbi:MAG: beta-lactamase family protein [Xanthomonadales bacterium]|nr:beta-lactamase family protein [Xanthomonadales bacterium]MDH4020470.1 beta-lactamase family protein [Xanthomonadales bacterium]
MKRLPVLFALFFCAQLHAQPFDGLSDDIANGDYGNLKAVVISRHGEVIYEDYFRGTFVNELHVLNSVTKSVGSALIGIANRQGKIQTDDQLPKFFNALYPMSTGSFSDKQAITVEAVLQQRHGITWDEWTLDYRDVNNPLYGMIASGDWYRNVLTTPIDAQPGEKFAYSTGVSTLMSRMIRSTTGMSPRAFAMAELFGPLGISNIHWEGWSAGGRGSGLTDWPNPDEDEPLGFGIWMKPRDMLKFGQLYLDDGVYNGRRILDKGWIDASWKTYSNSENTELFTNPGSGYGYQWWVTRLNDTRGRSFPAYYADGWGHQFILVIPELDVVFVSVADDYDYTGPGIGTILRTVVLPELNPRLDNRYDGAWYDPQTDGQGVTLEILDDGNRLVGFWYTYDENGEKRWFIFNGEISGDVAEVSILQTSGGRFLQPDPVEESEWGTGRFITVDCNHVNFEIISAEVKTTVELTRITGNCS